MMNSRRTMFRGGAATECSPCMNLILLSCRVSHSLFRASKQQQYPVVVQFDMLIDRVPSQRSATESSQWQAKRRHRLPRTRIPHPAGAGMNSLVSAAALRLPTSESPGPSRARAARNSWLRQGLAVRPCLYTCKRLSIDDASCSAPPDLAISIAS